MKELENLSTEEKIDYLIKKIEQIDKTVNPPFWKTFLKWFLSHFWTWLILGVLAYFMWQVWEMVQAVQAQIDAVTTSMDSFKVSVGDQFKGLGEALDSITNFDINQLKFWE